MYRNSKKGFTVVELVIVIAIIAILAAVLIPTFAGLIQKANESKDTQLVKNLNTALAVDNKEHKTMTSALEAAAAFGYDVGKINASATDNEILWDSVNDLFCYYNKSESKIQYIPNFEPAAGKTPATYQLWKIYDGKNGNTVPAYDSQTYSIYWAGEDAPSVTEVKVGFDVGNCPVAFDLTYKNTGSAQSVVIRTNSYDMELTVNSPADTVAHYNKANSVSIIEVANESYHEYGDVLNTIALNKGNLEIEDGADINIVRVQSTDHSLVANNIKLSQKNGSNVNSIIFDTIIPNENLQINGNVNNIQLPIIADDASQADKDAYNALYDKIETSISEEETNLIKRDSTTPFYSDATKTSYATLCEAVQNSNGTFTITYTGNPGDVIDMGEGRLNELQGKITGKNVTIDLAGAKIERKTPSSDGKYYSFTVPENSALTICNGSLEIKCQSASNSALGAYAGAELVLSNINMTTDGAAVYPDGRASRVVIENSNIYTTGAYGVGTNRQYTETFKIEIRNSTITSTGSSAVFINTTGMVNIEDSHLIGCVHGLLVRISHVNVKNTVIETTETEPGIFAYNNFANGYNFAPWWQGGNTIPAATVVLGDYFTNDTYADIVSVKFENVKLISADETVIPHVLCAASRANTSVTFIYDDDCVVNRVVLYGEDYVGSNAHTFTHNGSITVNGKNLKED